MKHLWHRLTHHGIFGADYETIQSCGWCRVKQRCPYCEKRLSFDLETDRSVHGECVTRAMIDDLWGPM